MIGVQTEEETKGKDGKPPVGGPTPGEPGADMGKFKARLEKVIGMQEQVTSRPL